MSLNFNASNRKLVVTSASPLEGMTEFSAILWFKLSATPAKDDGLFVRQRSGGALAFRLIFDDTSGNMQFAVDRTGSIGFKVNSTLGLSVDTWGCVAVSFSATSHLDMYIGSLTAKLVAPSFSSDTDGSGALIEHSGDLTVGNNQSTQGSRFATGSMAVLKLFDKRLTLQQLIAEQFSNVNTVDRNYYAELGQTGIITQADWSRNANNGAITGATTSPHVPLESPFGADVYMPSAIVAPTASQLLLMNRSIANYGGMRQ